MTWEYELLDRRAELRGVVWGTYAARRSGAGLKSKNELEGELRAQTEHARVHVARRREKTSHARSERGVERERDVIVRHVQDVQASREPPVPDLNGLLDREIELADAGAVFLARREQVDRNRAGRRHRA